MHFTHHDQPQSIFALAALPTPAGKACLAATEQGLWNYTAPKGWQPVAPQFAQVAISAVAVAGKTVLIGSADGVAISRNEGETWHLATLPIAAHVLGLALSPNFSQDSIAWAATAKDGVLRSPDAGMTWHAWNYGLLDMGINALAVSPQFAEDETVFAATEHGVFISENSGRAWREFGFPITAGPVTALALPASHSPLSALWAATEGHGLWQWNGGGEEGSWQRVAGLKAENINGLISTNTETIAATTDGVFAAKVNGKAKWQKRADIEDGVCLLALGDTLVIGTAGGGVWHGA